MSNEGAATETRATHVEQEDQKQESKVPCEVYSRIVGYLRPVQNWNKGKRQEFAARRAYRVKEETAQ
jgi:anaerobic ribonucleoside-triphosphate reductase